MKSDIRREEVEDFLYMEARLLDEWRLEDWEKLFTDDGRYLVPPVGISNADAVDPANMLFLIADDRTRIHQRIVRLMKKSAHAEYPHSRTRHCITNVELRGHDDSGHRVSAAFTTHRIRRRELITYVGQLLYTLVRVEGRLAIREKRACLDLDVLAPQGGLTLIL
jgi:p-cumate 2,3-dioxygenase beta subunit